MNPEQSAGCGIILIPFASQNIFYPCCGNLTERLLPPGLASPSNVYETNENRGYKVMLNLLTTGSTHKLAFLKHFFATLWSLLSISKLCFWSCKKFERFQILKSLKFSQILKTKKNQTTSHCFSAKMKILQNSYTKIFHVPFFPCF